MNVMKSLFILFILFIIACSTNDETSSNTDLKIDEYDYFDEVPLGISFLENNNWNDEKASLGRILFYDKKLSLNNSTSCASCHSQEFAFAEDLTVSTGLFGEEVSRNSNSLAYSAFRGRYFWDGRSGDINKAVLEPIKNHTEMAFENIALLENRLQSTDYYPSLFEEVYGSELISEDEIGDALGQFLSSMYSFSSKYDKGLETAFSNFNSSEIRGKNLFFDELNCNHCHNGYNFDSYYRESNIGLDQVYEDQGASNGRFRVPTLRNIGMTAPYMHDGRYESLKDVVEFYNSGIQDNPNLDWVLLDENGKSLKMNLTDTDINDLVAFLSTLDDNNLVTDRRFSNPF